MPRLPRPPGTALTPPRNSATSRIASFGLETSHVVDAIDRSEPPSSILDAVDEHLRHYDDTLPTIGEDAREEACTSDPEESYKAKRHQDHPLDPSNERERPLDSANPSHHQRSSSVPVKILKSALTKSPPNSPPEYEADLATRRKKRAHFEDMDHSTLNLTLHRSATDPSQVLPGREVTFFAEDDQSLTVETPLSEDEIAEPIWSGRTRSLVVEMDVDVHQEIDDTGEPDGRVSPSGWDRFKIRSAVTSPISSPGITPRDEDDYLAFGNSRRREGSSEATRRRDQLVGDDHLRIHWDRKPTSESGLRPSPNADYFDDDDGPIALPLDQQDDELGVEMSPLPTTNEAPRDTQPPSNGIHLRRLSDPHIFGKPGVSIWGAPRRASMTDFTVQGRVRHKLRPLTSKASLAEPAITVCSVRAIETPKLNTVYEHPDMRSKGDGFDERRQHTAQTVCSGSSMYQMLWEEPSRSTHDSDDDETIFEDARDAEVPNSDESLLAHVSRSPSPMGRVKTKLAAWSWAREMEQDGESESRSIPLLAVDDGTTRWSMSYSTPTIDEEEDPPAPPNTEKGSKTSSARQSGLHAPYEGGESGSSEIQHDERDDEEEAEPASTSDNDGDESPAMELRCQPTLPRASSMPSAHNYLAVAHKNRSQPTSPSFGVFRIPSPVPRRLPSLAAAGDERFKTHRDSVELFHQRQEREDNINKQLMMTRDSFLLTRSKYDSKYPKAGATLAWSHNIKGLSPIMDASPPDARASAGWKAMSRLVQEATKVEKEATKVEKEEAKVPGEEEYPVEHGGCAICGVDRPEWFAAKHRRGVGAVA